MYLPGPVSRSPRLSAGLIRRRRAVELVGSSWFRLFETRRRVIQGKGKELVFDCSRFVVLLLEGKQKGDSQEGLSNRWWWIESLVHVPGGVVCRSITGVQVVPLLKAGNVFSRVNESTLADPWLIAGQIPSGCSGESAGYLRINLRKVVSSRRIFTAEGKRLTRSVKDETFDRRRPSRGCTPREADPCRLARIILVYLNL